MNRLLTNLRLREFDDCNRPRLCVPVRACGEGDAHYARKLVLAERYQDRAWAMEAVMKSNGKMCKWDFVVLDSCPPLIVEVVSSESFGSLLEKREHVPRGWAFRVEYAGGGL